MSGNTEFLSPTNPFCVVLLGYDPQLTTMVIMLPLLGMK